MEHDAPLTAAEPLGGGGGGGRLPYSGFRRAKRPVHLGAAVILAVEKAGMAASGSRSGSGGFSIMRPNTGEEVLKFGCAIWTGIPSAVTFNQSPSVTLIDLR